MIVESKLASLGLPLPDLETDYRKNRSGAKFMSHRAVGALLYLSGTVPIRDEERVPAGARRAATSPSSRGTRRRDGRWSQALSAVKYALGDLDRLDTAIHLTGYVNSAPGFADQPRVINGAADLLVELYGERGKPTRAAIGCQGLALNSSVELVLVVSFTGTEVRPPLARDRWAR